MYNLQNRILLGCFEAYQKDSSLSSLLETLLVYYRLLPYQSEEYHEPVEVKLPEEKRTDENENDEEEEEERGAPVSSQKSDEAKDYDKVKEHMHMVLARYAKEGIIDYKEAAQIHDVWNARESAALVDREEEQARDERLRGVRSD